jgi:hypothetical protein
MCAPTWQLWIVFPVQVEGFRSIVDWMDLEQNVLLIVAALCPANKLQLTFRFSVCTDG